MTDRREAQIGRRSSDPAVPPVQYMRHDDDEWADEVRITLQERWKDSELSGSEWRFSAVVTISRKGTVMRRIGYHSIRAALLHIGSVVGFAPADYSMGLAHQGEREAGCDSSLGQDLCSQPGCVATPTVELRLKRVFCAQGHGDERAYPRYDLRRHFCERHSTRGDCALEDADNNYIRVGG